MNVYQKVSTAVALFLYLPLALQILNGEVTQNLATWILWGTLDGIAAASMFRKGGNWHLPTAYVAGSVFTLVCMINKHIFAWTWFETLICFMVVACVVGWKMSGSTLATILSSIGTALAGVPQLKDAIADPTAMPFEIYLGFLGVNILSVKGGKDWSIKERFYPICCGVICVAIVVASARKFF